MKNNLINGNQENIENVIYDRGVSEIASVQDFTSF